MNLGAARADDVGAIGTVAGLQVNDDSADTYLQFHGRAWVKNAEGTLDEYRWGGTSCGTRILDGDQVAALHRALDAKNMQVQLLYQSGQGDAKCIVAFTLVPKKNLKLGIP
jgi:hypothetical protein